MGHTQPDSSPHAQRTPRGTVLFASSGCGLGLGVEPALGTRPPRVHMGHGSRAGPALWAAWPSRAQDSHLGDWVSLLPFPGHQGSRQASSDNVTLAPSQGRRSAGFPYVTARANVLCPKEPGWQGQGRGAFNSIKAQAWAPPLGGPPLLCPMKGCPYYSKWGSGNPQGPPDKGKWPSRQGWGFLGLACCVCRS